MFANLLQSDTVQSYGRGTGVIDLSWVLRGKVRDETRFGQTEAGWCPNIRLECKPNIRSPTEEGVPPQEPCGALSAFFF